MELSRSPKLSELDQNQLNAFLNSIEGQFQVEQSREFAKEDDTDSLERFVSDKAITVVNSEKTLNSGAYVNENGKNETMTLICSTITCEQPHDCVNHVQPEGHCCPVCAGLLNLAFREVNPDEINTIIYESMSEVKDDDGTAMWDAYNYSLEKILEDQLSTRFQITIMPNESTTYDAEIMMDLLILCLKKFGRTNHLLKHYEIHTAKTRHVYKWSSIFLGTTIYAIIVLAAASFYIYRHPGVIGQLLRLFRRPEISLPRVFWVKTDDCVTLVNPNADIDTSDQSEEENSTSLESLSTLPEESPEESLQSETEVDPSEAGMQNIPLIEF